jgi:acetyl-CoA C-acetyltransferase
VDPAIYQAAIDADRGPGSVAMAEGAATVETYTVMHDREGPAFGIVVGRLPDGRRFVANTPEDPGLLAEMEQRDYVGAAGRVVNDGSRNTFNPG